LGYARDTDQSAGQIDRRPTGGLTPLKDLGSYGKCF